MGIEYFKAIGLSERIALSFFLKHIPGEVDDKLKNQVLTLNNSVVAALMIYPDPLNTHHSDIIVCKNVL